MTIKEKAALLDELVARHGASAEHLATGEPDPKWCRCDPSVGVFHCESCDADALFKHVAKISKKLRERVPLSSKKKSPLQPNNDYQSPFDHL